MSTNYYIRTKEDNKKFEDQKNLLDNLSPKIDQIFKSVEDTILQINPDYESEMDDRNQYLKEKINRFIRENVPMPKEKHIGQFVSGWRFLFQSKHFKGLDDLKNKFNPETEVIVDEYDRIVDLADLISIIESTRSSPKRSNDGKVIAEHQNHNCDHHNDEGYRLISSDFS